MATGLPLHAELGPGQTITRMLDIPATDSTIISDVDVITDLSGLCASTTPLQLKLRVPDGFEIFLKEEDEDPLRDVWDNQTSRPASHDLDDFNSHESDGMWTLTLHNSSSSEFVTFDFERFHVRLHHDAAPACD